MEAIAETPRPNHSRRRDYAPEDDSDTMVIRPHRPFGNDLAHMPPPTDSDRRKARDAAIPTQDETIAEHLAEAMRSGELQTAPSFGKRMSEGDGWHETPVEFRLPFKILKNAGVAPPEIELFHRRAGLRRELAECSSEPERKILQQRLNELEQLIAFRLESMRLTGKL